MPAVSEIIGLLRHHGPDQYGAEAVSQTEHALQSAQLAEREDAADSLVAAALLHDIGHMLAKHPDGDADDRHESIGGGYLRKVFGPAVSEPVALHVAAKRYLCAVEPSYFAILSPVSVKTLALQGGPMTDAEVRAFEMLPHAGDAVRLRRWDEQAKLAGLPTRTLEDYEPLLYRLKRA
jgi:phosphonate degradation associated HDIG domain protein